MAICLLITVFVTYFWITQPPEAALTSFRAAQTGNKTLRGRKTVRRLSVRRRTLWRSSPRRVNSAVESHGTHIIMDSMAEPDT